MQAGERVGGWTFHNFHFQSKLHNAHLCVCLRAAKLSSSLQVSFIRITTNERSSFRPGGCLTLAHDLSLCQTAAILKQERCDAELLDAAHVRDSVLSLNSLIDDVVPSRKNLACDMWLSQFTGFHLWTGSAYHFQHLALKRRALSSGNVDGMCAVILWCEGLSLWWR